jgi:predicted house-cleaning noncanonical NTP pyrophosphatase (MazG superfamily)
VAALWSAEPGPSPHSSAAPCRRTPAPRHHAARIVRFVNAALIGIFSAAQHRAALLAKLVEQAREAKYAATADLPGELAGVLEVLRALTAAAGTSWAQLLALADDKRALRGGLGERILLDSVE